MKKTDKTNKQRLKRTEGTKTPVELAALLIEMQMDHIFLNDLIDISKLERAQGKEGERS